MSRYWMLMQIPWAILLYLCGGWPWVVYGISVRIVFSLIGHWIVGYLAHHYGLRDWHLDDHAVQGYNVPGFGCLSMGEAWHNNHHAFPDSARFGLKAWQLDPAWWYIWLMSKLGLAWKIQLPENLPPRPELQRL